MILLDATSSKMYQIRQYQNLSHILKKDWLKDPHLWKPLDNKNSSAAPDAIRHQKFLKDARKVFEDFKLDTPQKMDDVFEIMTREDEEGIVYLNCDLSNELMKLHNLHRILEEIDPEMQKESQLDLVEYKKELDEFEPELVATEFTMYQNMLIKTKDNIRRKVMEASLCYAAFEKFPVNIFHACATYFHLVAEGNTKIIQENIEPTLNFLEKYIEERFGKDYRIKDLMETSL